MTTSTPPTAVTLRLRRNPSGRYAQIPTRGRPPRFGYPALPPDLIEALSTDTTSPRLDLVFSDRRGGLRVDVAPPSGLTIHSGPLIGVRFSLGHAASEWFVRNELVGRTIRVDVEVPSE